MYIGDGGSPHVFGKREEETNGTVLNLEADKPTLLATSTRLKKKGVFVHYCAYTCVSREQVKLSGASGVSALHIFQLEYISTPHIASLCSLLDGIDVQRARTLLSACISKPLDSSAP